MLDKPIRCYIMGTESLLIECANILREKGHHILGVISRAEPILNWANVNQVPVIEPGKGLADRLSRPFDYFFSITNLSIVPEDVLALPEKGAINFHDGPLPRYAGLYATTWALLNGEKEHGVTWHTMTADVDKGEILKQRLFPIRPDETAFTLNVKCYENAIATFAELVDELAANTAVSRPQNLSEQTYFGKYHRPPANGVLDWTKPAAEIAALVRALDFGGYENPVAVPKMLVGEDVIAVTAVSTANTPSTQPPGTITAIGKALSVAAADGMVQITAAATLDGTPMTAGELAARYGLQVGQTLPLLTAEQQAALTELNGRIVRHESYWVKQLAKQNQPEIPYVNRTTASESGTAYQESPQTLPRAFNIEDLAAAFALYTARLSGKTHFTLGIHHPSAGQAAAGWQPFYAPVTPFNAAIDPTQPRQQVWAALQQEVQKCGDRLTFNRDVALRYPQLTKASLQFPVVVAQGANVPAHVELALLLAEDGQVCTWVFDTAVYSPEAIHQMQAQFANVLAELQEHPQRPAGQISLLSPEETHKLIEAWNDTAVSYPRDLCIHHLIEQQAEQRPNDIAVVFEDQQITYRTLNRRANQMARHLRHLGVGPDVVVGVFMERSIDMIVALVGIHKAGGAYLPLDPTYPDERIAFMVEDAGVPVILTQARLRDALPAHQAKVVQVDADWDVIAEESGENVFSEVQPHHLAYIIYTSGSTGKPKGVMVQHGNVVNFFAGMDERIPHDPPGTWLAVTSLSFDISVLELFWTLSRGFKVVVYADKTRQETAVSLPASPHDSKPIAFSLFYFASDESEEGVADKYHLLLEGAKYGDKHGFEAVWTPERHFHAFGGLYPNPSVASAAIAAITENIQIRAGSCVLPLHSPVRVAEEWALVDNLSRGRVGIAFAAGWQPNDFVLRPENYANRKENMFHDIEVVRQLWRGEAVSLMGPFGNDVVVRTLPRPVQKELPIWITVAGNPETFRMAGERGFAVLTHLLGQTVEQLGEKLEVYRQAWREAGHPGNGHVTLMLHTFIGPDLEAVRETVREPMKEYLRSSVMLIKQAAWHFPTFKQKAAATGKNPMEIFENEDLSEEEMDALLNFAFDRYFENSGLFGTPAHAMRMVNKLKAIDIDEIACQIDFGVPSAKVLAHLPYLNEVKQLAAPKVAAEDFSIAAQIARHQVTHFQCTPSMASMLLLDERTKDALRQVDTMMVGGEAFPAALANELKSLVKGRVINMYGPTETTIWSSTYEVGEQETAVSIGRPIANTRLYILDEQMQPVPVGVAGELYIGGDGVVRGYHNRPQLTAERFVRDPFVADPSARMYRTGDLARYRPDGNIDFLGRADFQVKVRGYRIELGEIEALLMAETAVREAVVVAREDTPGDVRLVAYIIPHEGHRVDAAALRDSLKANLPDFMIPAHFVPMTAFPLTPNKKTDRKALPAPDQVLVEQTAVYQPPTNELQQKIAAIWQELLNVPKVGIDDNFFDLGGHSLLTVQAHRRLKEIVDKEITITDMFRFPTVRALTAYLGEDNGKAAESATLETSVSRAASRREALQNRRNRRQRTR